MDGLAQAFDFPDTATSVGAPSFAFLAKGGYHGCPPLQKTQEPALSSPKGRSTHGFESGKRKNKGWATSCPRILSYLAFGSSHSPVIGFTERKNS